jgi:coenzyme F420-reducing hydrogenase alpha subunit
MIAGRESMASVKKSVDVNVHYVTRVEGHGNIVVNVKNGKLEKCELDIVEAPRFFESMLLGRRWDEASLITSRICGICAVGHATASVLATEDAMGIKNSVQTERLRRLNVYGETLQSHVLHVYFLAAPDFLKVGSVVPLVKTHPDVVKRALKLKKLANDICGVISGRKVHPISMTPGGFTRIPTDAEIRGLLEQLKAVEPDIWATVDLVAALAAGLPNFSRETEYEALYCPDEYALYRGTKLITTDGAEATNKQYKDIIKERVVDHSSSKHVSNKRSSIMVGALARFNNNFAQLHPKAKEAAAKLGLKPICTNTFHNTTAQVVEIVQVFYKGLEVCEELLAAGLKDEKPDVQVKAGRGVGLTEVPRGLLVHDYTYDAAGVITDANLIIPTGQNLANVEDDFRKFVPEILDQPQDEIRNALEMMVRAYDPCISCSVHMLNVKFVD